MEGLDFILAGRLSRADPKEWRVGRQPRLQSGRSGAGPQLRKLGHIGTFTWIRKERKGNRAIPRIFMCVYIYIHMYLCVSAGAFVGVCGTCRRRCVQMHVDGCVCMYNNVCVCMYLCLCICMSLFVHAYVRVHVRVHMSMCICQLAKLSTRI